MKPKAVYLPEKLQLIGISGTFSSGKDTIAHRLVADFGYTHVSTSDLVREEALRQYDSIERPVMHKVADEYRKENGAGAFVKLALAKPRPLVVTGLRSLGEAQVVKQNGGLLLFVDAPLEVRYNRMVSRLRDGEAQISLEEFRQREEKEMYSGPTDADFNIVGISKMADITFHNSGSYEQFIAEVYAKLGLKQ